MLAARTDVLVAHCIALAADLCCVLSLLYVLIRARVYTRARVLLGCVAFAVISLFSDYVKLKIPTIVNIVE